MRDVKTEVVSRDGFKDDDDVNDDDESACYRTTTTSQTSSIACVDVASNFQSKIIREQQRNGLNRFTKGKKKGRSIRKGVRTGVSRRARRPVALKFPDDDDKGDDAEERLRSGGKNECAKRCATSFP